MSWDIPLVNFQEFVRFYDRSGLTKDEIMESWYQTAVHKKALEQELATCV